MAMRPKQMSHPLGRSRVPAPATASWSENQATRADCPAATSSARASSRSAGPIEENGREFIGSEPPMGQQGTAAARVRASDTVALYLIQLLDQRLMMLLLI